MAKKKRTRAVKKTTNPYSRLRRPLVICLIALGLLALAFTPHAHPVQHTGTVPKKITAVAAPAPRQQSTPANSAASQNGGGAATATTTTKPAVKPAAPASIPQSTKREPVVTPSPSSSVSSLAPVPPPTTTGSSPASGSSTTTAPASPATTTGYTSSNWSGYMATTGHFTAITGSWTVPSNVTGPTGETSIDSAWIGIGGVSSGDLIQVGTEDTVSASGHVSSSAFYEMLPSSSVTIPTLTVASGDHITASVTETGANEWAVTITDTTSIQTFTLNTAYTSSNSSAEWIEEDPSYSYGRQAPFDYYGSVLFSSGTTTSSDNSVSIANSSAEPVTMLNSSGAPISTPSALTGGSFTVTRNQ